MIVHAEPILAGYGEPSRITFEAGDIVQRPAAGRHELAMLRAVLQVINRDAARRAIRHAAESLTPGGEL